MDLRVTKNIQFTRLIKAPVQQREFNFRRIPNTTIATFHVDVSDDKMNRYMFLIQKESNSWKITGASVPDWINQVESELNEILESEPVQQKLNDGIKEE